MMSLRRQIAIPAVLLAAFAGSSPAGDWLQWRGPNATGEAPSGNPPTEWSEDKNVKWKIPIDGRGSATPIIVGDKIFLLTAVPVEGASPAADTPPAPPAAAAPAAPPADAPAIAQEGNDDRPPRRPGLPEGAPGDGGLPEFLRPFDRDNDGTLNEEERAAAAAARAEGRGRRGPGAGEGRAGRGGRGGRGGFGGGPPIVVQKFTVVCLDRNTGKTLWSKVAREQLPHEGHHQTGSFASASPVSDGKHLFVSFGSQGIYCYDLDGNLKWDVDLGDMNITNRFGEGCSPAVYQDNLIVKWDHEGDSFLAVLDTENGQIRWKKDRDERTSWSTPLVVEQDGKPVVITSASGKVQAYDLASGDVVWEAGSLTSNVISSPVSADGMVFAMSGHRGSKLDAIRLGKTGNLAGTEAIAWSLDEATPYVPSPLLYQGRLYFSQSNESRLSCVDAATGKQHFRERIEGLGNVYASPVAAAGRVYLMDREGHCAVLQAGDDLKIIATNSLDDAFDASPAIAGDELYLRGAKHIYCIAAQ